MEKPIVVEESAGVFLYNIKTKLFLLMKRKDTSIWESLKGHIGDTETHSETIKREALEEAGIKSILIGKKLGIIEFKLEKENIIKMRKIHYYFAKTSQIDVILSDEHSDYKWLTYETVLEMLPFQATKEVFIKTKEEIISTQNNGTPPKF